MGKQSALVGLAGLVCVVTRGQNIDAVSLTKATLPAVVQVATDHGFCSGFLISSDGMIGTSLHILRNGTELRVFISTGESYSAEIVRHDEDHDLAILKIVGYALPKLKLGDSNSVEVGESVLAIGSPRGLVGTITTGIVSAIREGRIQTDAPVSPGNSGGPLINRKGEVIGIVASFVIDSQNLHFAVPVNFLHGMLDAPPQPSITISELNRILKPVARTSGFARVPVSASWISTASSARYAVKIDGDYVSAVRINVPGNIVEKIEVHKSGNLFVGSVHQSVTSFTGKQCAFDAQAEFTVVTSKRIEGAMMTYPADAQLDSTTCTYSKPKRIVRFAWIPE
jgi:S1-C subfamily serine protease